MMDEMTNELGVTADIYALRERLRWGWKLFSGLLPRAASGEGTGSSTPGIHGASASEGQEWEGSSGLLLQGVEKMGDWYGGDFSGERTSRRRKGRGRQDRPDHGEGDLLFLLTQSYIFVCVDCARGPPAQVGKVRPPPPRSTGTRSGRDAQTPSDNP